MNKISMRESMKMMKAQNADRVKGMLWGLVVGDCLGSPIQFTEKDAHPYITEMVPCPVFGLPAGYWTDDSSMAFCIMESAVRLKAYDLKDIANNFVKWHDGGFWSSVKGHSFDVGAATSSACRAIRERGSLVNGEESSQGNGSIMRFAPSYWLARNTSDSRRTMHEISDLTHASSVVRMVVDRLAAILDAHLKGVRTDERSEYASRAAVNNSGWAVSTLQAALWAFETTETFEDGMIAAVNLGGDADSIGAVYGQIAGAYYGFASIPRRWVERIVNGAAVAQLIDAFMATFQDRSNDALIGTLVGDIVGSRFEHYNCKSKSFTLFDRDCTFTDDTVMTLAIADALGRWNYGEHAQFVWNELCDWAIASMQAFGRAYPHAGYGGRFRQWLQAPHPNPYGSWGNGAAMRVSACGCAARSLEEARSMSKSVTIVTHDHPEGIKGAEATAVAVYMAGKGASKAEIREMIAGNYYPLDFRLDEIRASYQFDVSCQGSVPQALEAFFESDSFEDAIRNAISIGGDSDTIGAICGGVAGAYYGVPESIRAQALAFLPRPLADVLHKAEQRFCGM